MPEEGSEAIQDRQERQPSPFPGERQATSMPRGTSWPDLRTSPKRRRIAVGSLAARLIRRERAQARSPWAGLRNPQRQTR